MTSATTECPTRLESPSHWERAARAELRGSAYPALRQVCCTVNDGRVILDGTVPSFYMKQIAQCLLLNRLGGEVRVENCLEVASCEVSTASVRESFAEGTPTIPHMNSNPTWVIPDLCGSGR